ncbi:MAG TPA: DUF2231 domain-containing protein [Acidimicrobiia bacterium]|nr:DUF2231 domain-containing protein [Acidimicrobiia bacterium]
MELETLFGLPAHPLVVHAAVVLLPLAALGTLAVALVPKLRATFAVVVVVLALGATVAVGLAQGSGEALEDAVDETELIDEHTEHAEQVLPWAIGLSAVALGVAGWTVLQRRGTNLNERAVTAVLIVLALVTATGATWTVVDVGHSGAKATWDDVESGD